MDLRIINFNTPDKKYITERTSLICKTIGILFLVLLIINKYYYKTFNLIDKLINYISFLCLFLIFFYCFINFNAKNLTYVHYFTVLFIWVPLLFCKNPSILMFYIFYIIVILIGWTLNNGICMLGELSWDYKINEKKYEGNNELDSPWRGLTFIGMIIILFIKIIYYTYLNKNSK